MSNNAMKLSDQSVGAVMMALQKSLMEQSDIVPVLKEIYEFINEPVFTHDFSKLKKSKIDTNKILTGGQLEYYTKRNWWKGYRYR